MEATIHITGKSVAKVLGAACLATGIVALSAVVASGAAVGAVAEGFKSAKNTMQKILRKDEALTESTDEVMVAEAVEEKDETAEIGEAVIESINIDEGITAES